MLEVKKPDASEIKYPVGRKHKHLGVVVILGSKTQAIRVDKDFGAELNPTAWAPFTDENTWEPVDIHIYG